MGRFFTPQSGSPSPGEINKMKGISVHTAVRLHNPYFPKGSAAAIDQTCCKALWGVVNESGPWCVERTVCVVLGSQHLEPELVNKHSDRKHVTLHDWCNPLQVKPCHFVFTWNCSAPMSTNKSKTTDDYCGFACLKSIMSIKSDIITLKQSWWSRLAGSLTIKLLINNTYRFLNFTFDCCLFNHRGFKC